MNDAELNRIALEAAADEAAETPQAGPEQAAQVGEVIQADLATEFADFLDLMAQMVGVGMGLPSVASRFNHSANLAISQAAIKLCEKYGIDARSLLIGENSVIGAWLGLGFAIGMPGYGCWKDYKSLQASKAKEGGEGGDDKQQGQ